MVTFPVQGYIHERVHNVIRPTVMYACTARVVCNIHVSLIRTRNGMCIRSYEYVEMCIKPFHDYVTPSM